MLLARVFCLLGRPWLRHTAGGHLHAVVIQLPEGALARLGSSRRDWRLVIVGPVTPYARELAAADDRVILLGTFPPTRTPEFLAMADLVVLPQRNAQALSSLF